MTESFLLIDTGRMEVVGEVTHDLLKASVGYRVEVTAFGISYRGRLKRFDPHSGTIEVVDKDKNSATLEIERIVGFKRLGR